MSVKPNFEKKQQQLNIHTCLCGGAISEACGEEPPELGSEPAPPFQEPLTLIMPHCFEPEDGKLACVFLGAPHGATQFERLSTMNERGEILQLADGELRVPIPYAGTFCAFSSLMIDDIAAVRFYIYTREETPREGIVSLRVHICPNLADRVEEMDLTESAQWGVAKCVGSSPVLYLCQGEPTIGSLALAVSIWTAVLTRYAMLQVLASTSAFMIRSKSLRGMVCTCRASSKFPSPVARSAAPASMHPPDGTRHIHG